MNRNAILNAPVFSPKMTASLRFNNFPCEEFKKFLSLNSFGIKKPADANCLVMGIYEYKKTTYKLFVHLLTDIPKDWYVISLKVYRKDNTFSPKYKVEDHLHDILKQFYKWDKETNPSPYLEEPVKVSHNDTLANPEE